MTSTFARFRVSGSRVFDYETDEVAFCESDENAATLARWLNAGDSDARKARMSHIWEDAS